VAGEPIRLLNGRTNPTVAGRYGPGGPGAAGVNPTVPTAPWYSQVDFDAVNSGAMTLPAANTFTVFPTYPAGWTTGMGSERCQRKGGDASSKFNYYSTFYNPVVAATASSPSPWPGLLRYGEKGSPALTSDLLSLMHRVSSITPLRQLVTPLSADFNTPGLVPC